MRKQFFKYFLYLVFDMRTFKSRVDYLLSQKEIRESIENIYIKGKCFDLFLKGLGVTKNQLSKKEVLFLKSYVKYAGKKLLVAAFKKWRQEGVDRKQALEKLKKELSLLAAHDLIHIFFSSILNNIKKNRKNKSTTTPTFLKVKGSEVTSILEEFPAILWSTSLENQPPFISLIRGKNKDIIKDFLEFFSFKEEKKLIDLLAKKLSLIKRKNFQSLMIGYLELVSTSFTLLNERELNKVLLDSHELRIKKRKFSFIIKEVRNLYLKELKNFKNDYKVALNTNQQILRLFFYEARLIFDNYEKNNRIILGEFFRLHKLYFNYVDISLKS